MCLMKEGGGNEGGGGGGGAVDSFTEVDPSHRWAAGDLLSLIFCDTGHIGPRQVLGYWVWQLEDGFLA